MSKKLFTSILCMLLIAALFAGCSGGSNAVRDFLDEYGAALEARMAPMAFVMGEGGDIALEAGHGNEMIYVFTIGEDIDRDRVNDILAMQTFTFEALATDLKNELDLDSFTLTVRFEDTGGNPLTTQSFEG